MHIQLHVGATLNFEQGTRNYLLLLHRQAALSFLTFIVRGGKSGQRRAPCFLAGRSLKGDSSVTENDHLVLMNSERGTGEKVR
jgi:hypothetical protein